MWERIAVGNRRMGHKVMSNPTVVVAAEELADKEALQIIIPVLILVGIFIEIIRLSLEVFIMGLFGFSKKKEESAPACACQCDCPTAEVNVSEVAKKVGSTADGALSIKVLGAGCASCHTLLENAKEAVTSMGLGVEVEYVTDMAQIAAYGVMSIPALVVNEKVVTMGKVLKANEVESLLNKLGVAQPAAASCCSCGGACGSQGDVASILILGPGCKNCQALEANTRAALEQIGDTTSTIGHVTDFAEIAKYGIMSTPGLVVDGKVVSYGKVLKPEDIVTILKKVRG